MKSSIPAARLLFACLTFFTASVTTTRAATPSRVTPVAAENRNRVNILVLGDGIPAPVMTRVQQTLTDEFNFYRPTGDGSSLALDEETLKAKRWDGILIGSPVAGQDPATYAAKLREAVGSLQSRNLVVTWAGPIATADDSSAVWLSDAARGVLRELNVPMADLRGALLPLGAQARTIEGALTERGTEAAAATLVSTVRKAVLARSTAWAELPATEMRDPSRLLADPSSLAKPADVPSAVGKTAMVYRAEAGAWQFNLHSFIAYHDGKFWAIWSSGHVDEDSPSQLVRFATSPDGYTWSESSILVDDPDGPAGPLRWMANGIYVEDGRLYALATRNEGIRDGMIWADARLIRFVWSGTGWKEDKVVADDCLIYFPPLKVNGRDFVVWRNSKAHFATAIAQPGSDHWEVTKIPGPFPPYRLSETAHYVDHDGVVHLIIRDQGATGFLYHSVSHDGGGTWTIPVKTNFPDAMSKNAAGRLSNGWFYLINNPKQGRPRPRDPLTITFSRDGWTFANPLSLRKGAPELRYPGEAKANFSFQYSHAMEHDGKLWVIYATNKEDIEVSSFELSQFPLND